MIILFWNYNNQPFANVVTVTQLVSDMQVVVLSTTIESVV